MSSGDSEGEKNKDRLPRGFPDPDPIGPEEKVVKATEVDLQNGWLGRHGKLSLTRDRLLFVPTPLDKLLRARIREIPLEEVTEIERYPIDVAHHSPGGKRPRMIVHTADVAYQWMVPDLDGWIDMLDIVARRRAEERGVAAPVVSRKGRENPLIGEI